MLSLASREKNILGWAGTICLFLILPVKLLRHLDGDSMAQVIDIVPSLLGPPGVFFLMLSSGGKLGRLSSLQAALITGALALGLEFLQLIPRPGLLARIRYTFDVLDLLASLFSLVVAYLIVQLIVRKPDPSGPNKPTN